MTCPIATRAAVVDAIHDAIFNLAEQGHLACLRDPDWLARQVEPRVRAALALSHLRPECRPCFADAEDQADFGACAESCWIGRLV